MGNVSTTAQLMRPDGHIVTYDYPVQVAMLMVLHPEYLVIQSPFGPVSPGERRNVKVMELDDRLVLGQSYIMYPIPEQFKYIIDDAVQRIGGVGHCTDKKLELATGKKRCGSKEGWKKRSFWRGKAVSKESGNDRGFTLKSGDLEMQMEKEKSYVAVKPPVEIQQKGLNLGRQRTVKISHSGSLQPVAEVEESALTHQ